MNTKDKFVITINRQFGTGGHEVGAELARRLGVKILDRQILKAVAEHFDADEAATEKLNARNISWRDDFSVFYQQYVAEHEYRGSDNDNTSRELFREQAEVIRKIAATESCIIIGRCAFDIFKDHPNALKIFIHSPMEARIRRIVDKYGVTEGDAKLMIVDNDCTRELYTKTFTGKDWTDARNYDISIDVRKFGINGAVDFLMKCIE